MMDDLYFGYVDFEFNGEKVRAWRVPLNYDPERWEIVFFAQSGCKFKVAFEAINYGPCSLQAFAGFEGSIDTALPQNVFDELLESGEELRNYVWWYGPDSGIFGELLPLRRLFEAAAERLSELVGYAKIEY